MRAWCGDWHTPLLVKLLPLVEKGSCEMNTDRFFVAEQYKVASEMLDVTINSLSYYKHQLTWETLSTVFIISNVMAESYIMWNLAWAEPTTSLKWSIEIFLPNKLRLTSWNQKMLSWWVQLNIYSVCVTAIMQRSNLEVPVFYLMSLSWPRLLCKTYCRYRSNVFIYRALIRSGSVEMTNDTQTRNRLEYVL